MWECWCNIDGLWCQCAGIVGVRISVDSDSGVKSDISEVTSVLQVRLLGRHGSDSLCRVERENKMAATYNVLAFKR